MEHDLIVKEQEISQLQAGLHKNKTETDESVLMPKSSVVKKSHDSSRTDCSNLNAKELREKLRIYEEIMEEYEDTINIKDQEIKTLQNTPRSMSSKKAKQDKDITKLRANF